MNMDWFKLGLSWLWTLVGGCAITFLALDSIQQMWKKFWLVLSEMEKRAAIDDISVLICLLYTRKLA